MKFKRLLLSTLAGLAFCFAAQRAASAGTLTVRDEIGLLSGSDTLSLRDAASRWSFDSVILVRNTASSRDAFLRGVKDGVSGPNVISIGIDPTHHFTGVFFGDRVGVPRSDYDTIFKQGNADFRAKDWAHGLQAIGDYANGVAHAVVFDTPQPQAQAPVPASRPAPVASAPHEGLGFFGWALILGVLGGAAYFIFRRRETVSVLDSGRLSNTTGGIEPVYSPTYARRAPAATVVVQQPSSGVDPLLAGVIGYELGKSSERHTSYAPPTPAYSPPAPVYNPSSTPSDGGGSSWSAPDPTPSPRYRAPTPAPSGGGSSWGSDDSSSGGGSDFGGGGDSGSSGGGSDW